MQDTIITLAHCTIKEEPSFILETLLISSSGTGTLHQTFHNRPVRAITRKIQGEERRVLLQQSLEEECEVPKRRLWGFGPKEDVKIMQVFLVDLPGVSGFASQILRALH